MILSVRLATASLMVLVGGCATIPYQEPQGDNVAKLDMPAREVGWVKYRAFFTEQVMFGNFEGDGCVYQAYQINAEEGTRKSVNIPAPGKTLVMFSATIGGSRCNVIGQIDVSAPGAMYKVEPHIGKSSCRMGVREINGKSDQMIPLNQNVKVFTGWSSTQYCLEGKHPRKQKEIEEVEEI